jgi:hypothetical protein
MNIGKQLFDQLVSIENIKPVSMVYEFPNKALMNFLFKYYNLNNPIYHDNNVITYCFFSDKNFNKYLDNYHRIIDVHQIEKDIDSYRKWSPLSKDFKLYNSHFTYKNIFPLKFQNNRIKIVNDRYNDRKNIENIFFSKKLNNNSDNHKHNNMEHSYDYQENNYYNLKATDDLDNKYNNFVANRSYQFNNNNQNQNYNINHYSRNINLVESNNMKNPNFKKDEYFSKYKDYYLIGNYNSNHYQNNNNNNSNYNYIKNNYFNNMNDENQYFKNVLSKQREKNNKLSENILNLSNRIKTQYHSNNSQTNNASKDIYYHRNRSYATLFDSIENKLREENDFNEYKKNQMFQ